MPDTKAKHTDKYVMSLVWSIDSGSFFGTIAKNVRYEKRPWSRKHACMHGRGLVREAVRSARAAQILTTRAQRDIHLHYRRWRIERGTELSDKRQ